VNEENKIGTDQTNIPLVRSIHSVEVFLIKTRKVQVAPSSRKPSFYRESNIGLLRRRDTDLKTNFCCGGGQACHARVLVNVVHVSPRSCGNFPVIELHAGLNCAAVLRFWRRLDRKAGCCQL